MKKLILASIALCLMAPFAQAEQGDVYLRAGATVIDPESNGLQITGLGNVAADSAASLTFNIEYMFADSWGVELLAAVPFKHDIQLDGTTIGETSHIPPTLTIKWHPTIGRIAPYVGVGANWTIFFNEKLNSNLDSVLNLEDSFGLAAQIGFDWVFANNWLINVDVRYIQIETDASVGGALAGGGSAALGTVDINPLVYGLNVGYKF
ncbi:MAG: outer membrane beta-barrel protein [Gammaproteobacteria bacterium]|nr:outer membrane beta-barrel protein [Gammaproteobacteria bacterium]NND36270.1 outer membrane beta-barrel protein [Gammaproteobacteria bacterium]